jgi:hypothetical protein
LRWTNLHIVDHGTLFEWMNSHSHHLLHFFLFLSDLVWLCFRKILLFLKGNKNKGVYLSIYLEAVKTANMSEGWSRDVKVKFVLFNKRNTNMTITKGGFYFPHNDLNILYMFRMWSSHFPFYATKFTLDTWFCQKPDMIWMQRRLTGTYSFSNQCFGKKKHMSISKHVHIGIWLAINSKNYASFRQVFQIWKEREKIVKKTSKGPNLLPGPIQ